MLKVAIVGCGKIADSHASQIQRIRGCEIVAACDREELMAQQFCQRFRVPRQYGELNEVIAVAQPDVVHLTTPPGSHFFLAKQCLESGINVYIEKPMTLITEEAEELVELAKKNNVKLTAGHDDQFRHAARRARQLIGSGYLGGPPVHMESYYCYEMDESSNYAKALLADKEHWVRKLPGQLLHNIISHGIARVAEYFTTEMPEVTVCGFVSPTLKRMGEEEIIDELRVILTEEERLTAYFTFSSQMRPSLHQFRIFGPKNGLVLEQDSETVIKLRGSRRKSYLEHFVPPVDFAKQYLGNLKHNVQLFLRNDFHMKSGMKYLIETFYQAIRGEGPLPIAYDEVLRTSRIMDGIFNELKRQSAERRQGRRIEQKMPVLARC